MKNFAHKLFKNKAETFGLLVFLLLAVMPLLLGIAYGILYSFGIVGLLSDGFTLEHWLKAVWKPELWRSLGYTVYLSLTTIGLTICGSLTLSLYLKNPLEKGLPGFSLYVPLAFPAVVVAFLVFQLFSQSGFFARILYQLGLIAQPGAFPSLIHDSFGIGIIVSHTFMAIPFFTLYFMNLCDQENIEKLSKVGLTLGASRFDRIRRIMVPLLLRRAFPALLLYTIFVMGSYEIPLILGQQSPQMTSVLVIRKLRKFSLDTIPEAYITALLFITIVFGLLFILHKFRTFSHDLD